MNFYSFFYQNFILQYKHPIFNYIAMLKTTQSFDCSLGLDSYMSPIRTNKSSNTIDTAASLQYSQITQFDGILRLNSNRDGDKESPLIKLNRNQSIVEVETTPREVTASRFDQLVLMQRWVGQAFTVYAEQQILLRNNSEKIRKLQHKNKLMKDEILHIKDMCQYFKQRYKKCKKQLKKKQSFDEYKIKLKISQSKSRVDQLYSQIEQIKQQINEQKQLRMQCQRKLMFQLSEPASRYPHPHQMHSPQLASFHSFNPNNGVGQSWTQELKRSPSFNQAQTPQFLSKKLSLDSHQPTYSSNQIIQALAFHMGNMGIKGQSPNSNSNPRSSSRMSGKWQNTQQQKDVLNILQSQKKQNNFKKKLILTQDFQQMQQNVLYSPTNIVQTPEFDLNINKNFKGKGSSFSSIHQQISEKSKDYSSSVSTPHKRDSNKRISPSIMQESKVKIQVDESASQASKYSIQKRKRPEQSMKQSCINIQIIEDQSKSGRSQDTSTEKDQSIQNIDGRENRKKSPTVQVKSPTPIQNLSIQEGHCSQILKKQALLPPPKIPLDKKLRKVTEQESDLFDSAGMPNMKTKNVKNDQSANHKQTSQTMSIKDMILDKDNLKQSEAPSFNWETIQTPREESQNNQKQQSNNFVKKKLTNEKKKSEEDQDDDFFNVNLLAVSKISKQKQLSERAFNSIPDQSSQQKNKKNLAQQNLSKSYNAKVNLQIPIESIVEQQKDDFYDDTKQKRSQKMKKCRKSSGSRFSAICQPTSQSAQLQRNQK